ncbi:uncharacterized protein LOC134783359 isoform X2 [Penaeus indicus]|uniref:uncharacterized protein LOC134783359 isoform X2 n=1 Tax=Penaeus indicus TaxID=29960 RepID=UPI00300C15D8
MKLHAPIFTLLSFASLSILAESSQADNKEHPTPKECENDYSGLLATAAAGAAVAVAAPLALPFLGFTSAGIVAAMQSVAAAGVGVAGNVGLASFGSAVAAGVKMAHEKVKETFGGEEDN